MSPDAKKLLKITGITLLVLVNIVGLFVAATSIKMIFEISNDPAIYCPFPMVGIVCDKPDIEWNAIFFYSLYIVVLLASLIIALKRGHRAWWYNILILVLGGPLALFLSVYPPF
jgi:lysylphosphatidylglycerol synthetase-like protein (DUF2156 family)